LISEKAPVKRTKESMRTMPRVKREQISSHNSLVDNIEDDDENIAFTESTIRYTHTSTLM